jgi:YidC/Oxa1 family membrane protein insertase
MDNVRLILIMILLFLGLMIYQAWQKDYATPPAYVGAGAEGLSSPATTPTPPLTPSATEGAAVAQASAVPDVPTIRGDDLPGLARSGADMPSSGRIRVDTDVFSVEIDLYGGDVRVARLPHYPVSIDKPEQPFIFMNDNAPHIFVAQSGLLSDNEEHAPTHRALYHAAHTHYTLAADQDSVRVPLTWRNDNGIEVTKVYEFKRGDYAIKVSHRIDNHSVNSWNARLYGQLRRTAVVPGANDSMFIYTYLGGALSSPTSRYEKIGFDDISSGILDKEQRQPWADGWLAMLQHYFVAAIIPTSTDEFSYYSRHLKTEGQYVLGLYSLPFSIAPGNTLENSFTLYVGPKVQERLAALAPSLDLTVDYGILWFIAQPLFWVLEIFYSMFGNWGWAIIALTILIKILFFYPSAISYRAMANMRKLQPRLLALKERYADDKSALNQAMMDLYRTEKINPLGGCLPVLIQIPVFIALYWVLLESVELRQAPFMLWIKDMSSADPYFILPLIMGATMIIQQKLNPAPLDPVQQKIMMILPIVFTVFFAFFPAGLVLYWVVNNILSIAQQWYITVKITGGLTESKSG